MPVIKKIIKNCYFELAKGQRRCKRNKKHIITKGEKCFVIKENMIERSYCLACAKLIVDKCITDSKELKEILDS